MNLPGKDLYKNIKDYVNTAYPSPLAYLIYSVKTANPPINDYMGKVQEIEKSLIDDNLPSGSGIDANITIESATKNKITLLVPFHHMDEHGFYSEWIDYRIKITVDFTGLSISISNTTTKAGDKYFIYDYLCDLLLNAFEKEL